MPPNDRLPRLNLVSVAAVCGLLYVFRTVLAPFMLAFVLALLVDSLLRSRLFARLGDARTRLFAGAAVGIGLTLGSAAIVLGGLHDVGERIPLLIGRLERLLSGEGSLAGADRSLGLENLMAGLDLRMAFANGLAALQEAMSGAFLVIVFLILMLGSRSLIKAKVLHVASLGRPGRMLRVIEHSVQAVQTYVWIQTITGLMIAVASGVLMAVIGLENAPFWALVLFVLSYIPVLGVAVGGLAPAAFALTQFPTLWPALIVFLGVQTVAFIVGNLIAPRMQAEAQNIDPAMSLLVTGVWTVLWGVPGAFLAIPLTLALMFLLAQYDSLRWLAILVSNNGDPLPGESELPASRG